MTIEIFYDDDLAGTFFLEDPDISVFNLLPKWKRLNVIAAYRKKYVDAHLKTLRQACEKYTKKYNLSLRFVIVTSSKVACESISDEDMKAFNSIIQKSKYASKAYKSANGPQGESSAAAGKRGEHKIGSGKNEPQSEDRRSIPRYSPLNVRGHYYLPTHSNII